MEGNEEECKAFPAGSKCDSSPPPPPPTCSPKQTCSHVVAVCISTNGCDGRSPGLNVVYTKGGCLQNRTITSSSLELESACSFGKKKKKITLSNVMSTFFLALISSQGRVQLCFAQTTVVVNGSALRSSHADPFNSCLESFKICFKI